MGPVALAIVEKMGDFDDHFTSDSLHPVSLVSCTRKNNQGNNNQQEMVMDGDNGTECRGMRYLQMLEVALIKSTYYQPNVNGLVYGPVNEDKVNCDDRDKAVTNLRCLHLFYGFSPETYALSVSLLDRFLCKVKVRPKYLSCMATACYFIAVKTVEEDSEIPYATELVKLSQCGGGSADLLRMEGIILDKLNWDLNPATTLTFVNNFYAIFVEKFPELSSTSLLESAVSKLEVCLCHYGFYGFQAQSLALAIFSCALQEVSASVPALSAIIDLQVYCKVSDMEFLQCRGMIIDYLMMYYNQKNKMPKEKRKWLISRRTMSQLRPTIDYEIELPTILESDDDNDCSLDRTEEIQTSSKLDQPPPLTYGAIIKTLPYHNETVLPVL